jgi:methionyl-tRNA formyltransferase
MARVVEQQLATAGAEMLVDVLKQRRFVPPHEDVGWYAHSGGPIDHAPKVTKQDRYVDFEKHTVADVIAKWNALGDLWCLLPTGERLILHNVLHLPPDDNDIVRFKPGLFVNPEVKAVLWFKGACGQMGVVLQSTLEGNKKGQGNAKLLQLFGPSGNKSVGNLPATRPLHRVI